MRFLLTLASVCFIFTCFCQDKGPVTIKHHEFQFGIGGWGTTLHSNLSIRNSKAVGSEAMLEYRYYHNSPFGIGFSVETASIKIDETDTTLKSANGQFLKLGLNFRYNIVSKPKFLFFIGTTHLITKFAYQRVNTNNKRSELTCKGFQHSLNMGIHWYFSKALGLFSDLRWQIQSVNVTRFVHDGNDLENFGYLPATDVFLNFRGLGFRLGVSLRF